jgi:DIS3-like exonuclease 2
MSAVFFVAATTVQVSDGSLKLYLCIMLRDNPVVTMAVATSVGGDRFFMAYLPELGCE